MKKKANHRSDRHFRIFSIDEYRED
jgi:hypothetical protein